jgi:hypothetical protein
MYNVYWLARWLLLWGSKYLEYNSSIRTKNTLNKQIIEHWIIKQSDSNKSKTETNQSHTADNNNRKLVTNMNKHWTYNWRLSCDCPIFARVKYLCDYKTDNCNPVCLGVSYKASDVMLSVSLLFQQLTHGLLKNHRTLQQLCCFIPNTYSSAVPVEFHNCNDSAMRVAGRLRVPIMHSKDILRQAKRRIVVVRSSTEAKILKTRVKGTVRLLF